MKRRSFFTKPFRSPVFWLSLLLLAPLFYLIGLELWELWALVLLLAYLSWCFRQ